MEFTLFEDVGFIFKTYKETAQLEIYAPGEQEGNHKPQYIFRMGDLHLAEWKQVEWRQVIKGKGYVSKIITRYNLVIGMEIHSIENNQGNKEYKFIGTPAEIRCTETSNDYETITEYDSEGFVRTTNFFNRLI